MNIMSWTKYKTFEHYDVYSVWGILSFVVIYVWSVSSPTFGEKKKKWSGFDVIQLRYLDCGTSLNFV